jgi:hypothetical protein
MGLPFRLYLNASKVFVCASCGTHLATSEEIISKQFQGQHGKAFLMYRLVNVSTGISQERDMTTGAHIVRDIFCLNCQRLLGWQYITAHQEPQKYKEGKYILEMALVNEISTAT